MKGIAPAISSRTAQFQHNNALVPAVKKFNELIAVSEYHSEPPLKVVLETAGRKDRVIVYNAAADVSEKLRRT